MTPILLSLSALAADLAIINANILPISDEPIESGVVLVEDGQITAVGYGLEVPEGAEVFDAEGRWLTPGLIDVHSHMGVYAWPGTGAHGDGNEATAPTTPRVWAGDSVLVEDPAFSRARAGGITTIQVLPGSANLIGGQTRRV